MAFTLLKKLVTSSILGKSSVSRLVNVPLGKVNKANSKHTQVSGCDLSPTKVNLIWLLGN
jgi:hypothetical protein